MNENGFVSHTVSEGDMDFENRITAPEFTPEDAEVDNPLRPRSLEEYIGQEKAKEMCIRDSSYPSHRLRPAVPDQRNASSERPQSGW